MLARFKLFVPRVSLIAHLWFFSRPPLLNQEIYMMELRAALELQKTRL